MVEISSGLKFSQYPDKFFPSDLQILQEKLTNKEHFAFNKAADGELAIVRGEAIDRTPLGNGEFKYTPGNPEDEIFRQKLIDALKYHHEQYFVGLACPCCVGKEKAIWMRNFVDKDEQYLTWANLLVNSNYDHYVKHIVPLFSEYEVILVCNYQATLDNLPFSVKQDFRCGANAWRADYHLLDEIKNYLESQQITNHLFLFCCGPLGNILVHQLFTNYPDNTYLDIGSTLDPWLFGEQGYTRGYLKNKPEINKECKWHPDDVEPFDLVLVVPEINRGWILDGICQEIVKYFAGSYRIVYFPTDELPLAKTYFFANHPLPQRCFKLYPQIKYSQLLVWHPHPENLEQISYELVQTLNQCDKIICPGSKFTQLLIDSGVKPDQVTYVLGGADPDFFLPHQRQNGVVGFCSAYYQRKAPDRILAIIKAMPQRQFLLLGRKWEEYEQFAELKALPNFTYVEASYSEYPQYYAQMDVFVSPAMLEGGPIPLLEAMMCNIVPVASNTGFAIDLINHGENGFIFDVDSSVANICNLIEQAFEIETDIRSTVINLSWQNFSQQIQALMSVSLPDSQNRLQQLQVEYRTVYNQNQNLLSERKSRKVKVEKLYEERKEMKSKIKGLNNDIQQLKQDKQQLKSKLSSANQGNKKLKAELEAIKSSKWWKLKQKWDTVKHTIQRNQ